MKLFWCGWELLGDDDRKLSCPDNMSAWCTGTAWDDSYTSWVGIVAAETVDDARHAYTQSAAGLPVRDRFEPSEVDKDWVERIEKGGRFPGLKEAVNKIGAVC